VGVHGAQTIQQCLDAGLLDEIHIDLAAVLLGAGVRLFDLSVPNIRIRMVDAQGRVRRTAVNAARLHRRGFV
jgi:dihydrofolate reductase